MSGKILVISTESLRSTWNMFEEDGKVKILTFDRGKIPELPQGIDIVRYPNHRYLWPLLLWLLPWLRRRLGSWADVIKTNQSERAFFYTLAAGRWRKPIVLRCGYVYGEYLETTLAKLTWKLKFYRWLEAKGFEQATYCQVTTEELSQWVQKKYHVPKEKMSVVPNFVDTEIFKPMGGIQKRDGSIISVGRLSPVKQFDLLIKACAEIPGCTLTIIGEGPERGSLEDLGKSLRLDLRLPGNIPNEELPRLLQEHRAFAITSKREGHPKALIEAMACGMPCIGNKTTGIQNIIKHGENGWLVEADVESLKQGLSLILGNEPLSEDLGRKAYKYASEAYSFRRCFNLEYVNMHRLLSTQ